MGWERRLAVDRSTGRPAPDGIGGARWCQATRQSSEELGRSSIRLPTAGARTATHIQGSRSAQDAALQHPAVTEAAADAVATAKGFLGRS